MNSDFQSIVWLSNMGLPLSIRVITSIDSSMLVLPKCGESIAPHDAVSIVVPKKRELPGIGKSGRFPTTGKARLCG